MERIRKPEWLKVKIGGARSSKVGRKLNEYELNSVCDAAGCPNKGECYKAGTATFMLLGNHCTRNCTFCKVTTAKPEQVDVNEPTHVAQATRDMNLRHVVVTSVTRDDLPDGGAEHFANTIYAIRELNPTVSIEVLIPDFKGNKDSLQTVINAKPDILNHNVETVSELYPSICPRSDFDCSLELLYRVKQMDSAMFTKSGFMVGLGETEDQVFELLRQLRQIDCDIVTIGQYLQPSARHYQVREYVHPDQFLKYKEMGLNMGIKSVSSGPLVRSSYHAAADFEILQRNTVCL